MATNTTFSVDVPPHLIEAIRCFPTQREVEHCGVRFHVPPFDMYATCPQCKTQLKLRGFSAQSELTDVFDAVFEWMNQPQAESLAQQRRKTLPDEDDED